MNLKQIPLRLNVDHSKTIYLESDQPGELMSGSITADPDVEILDPNIHIATIGEGGTLKIEMRIKKGRGYVQADENFEEDLPIGYIPLDSVHSPIKRVNYSVEAARLGQTTDYDKLVLDIWTNGCILPQDAIAQAAFPSLSALFKAGNQFSLMSQYRKLQDLICFITIQFLQLFLLRHCHCLHIYLTKKQPGHCFYPLLS